MSSSRNDRDDDLRRHQRDDRHRSRSKSRSKSRRHCDDYDGHTRSRSRSIGHSRRHRRRSSRSHSRDHVSSSKHSRRRKDSRSYTRSRSRSRSSHHSRKHSRNHRSKSRSPKKSSRKERHDNRKTRSRSTERNNAKKISSEDRDSYIKNDNDFRKFEHNENSSTQYFNSNTDVDNLENLPLPEQEERSYEYFDDSQEPIDKERIHREMEEKLRLALAKEGKVYPPPKPEASHPVFANDGSFLEIFKKMQEAQQQTMNVVASTSQTHAVSIASTSAVAYTTTNTIAKPVQPPPPLVGRRRGGKILKTGVVAKPKAIAGSNEDKDFWSLYLAEVNKYKNNACELDSGNRPLLK